MASTALPDPAGRAAILIRHPGNQRTELAVGKHVDAMLAQQLGGDAAAGFGLATERPVVDKLAAARRAAVGEQGKAAAVAVGGCQRQMRAEQVLLGDIAAARLHHPCLPSDNCGTIGHRDYLR